nr:retrovirus-related Pol polyprotein from transposon TNT 1-94 [Tanacetum cinerariifolium]
AKIYFEVCYLPIRGNAGRPMRLRDCARWDKGHKHMGALGRGVGTVLVRAKSTESISQTYTRYKTLLNELANDGVNLSKHEINVGFMNSLLEKWLTFSQGLRNANHTQTLDLADIYGRFVYEYNLIQRSQADPKVQKDYKAEYKKMKSKLALLEASSSSSQNPKIFQPKNKGLVVETFDWDEEEVSDDEEVTQVKVLMALVNDELTIGKSHACNRYDQEMVPKTKEWVERLNPNSKLSNFNTGRILVSKSQPVNESLESTKTLNTPESSKDSESKSLTLLPPLKNLQEALPSSEEDHRTSDHEMYIASLKRSKNYKAQPYQYASSSKHILKAKAKPFPPCIHCGFNDHRPNDYRNYPECGMCESYDHFISRRNRVI